MMGDRRPDRRSQAVIERFLTGGYFVGGSHRSSARIATRSTPGKAKPARVS